MSQYTAQSLEVLSGLDPVRRRPGMYTDTSRPNHLAQEVIDNAVDEALAGYCTEIEVTINKDNSIKVIDNGLEALKELEICETDSYDFILLDINLPGANGWQVLAKISGVLVALNEFKEKDMKKNSCESAILETKNQKN